MGIPRTPADLAKHQAVVYDQGGGGTAWTFRRGGAKVSVIVDGRVRVSAAEGVREGVFAGLGLAIASDWMFAPELKSGAVKSVLDDWLLPPIDLWTVFPTGRQVSAKARAFASFIEKQLSSEGCSALRGCNAEEGRCCLSSDCRVPAHSHWSWQKAGTIRTVGAAWVSKIIGLPLDRESARSAQSAATL